MILTYLYDLGELNKMGDGIVLNIENYSFRLPKMYKVNEAKEIIKEINKPVFINLQPLYHDKDLSSIYKVIEELKDAHGFIFQDLGLIKKFKELNIIDKAIYAPETFITNRMDKDYFKSCGLNKFLISREITLSDINSILKNKGDTSYMYQAFGHQLMFYSARNHLSNFDKHYSLNLNLKNNFNIDIKEETRDEHYNVIEDERGFRIYKGEIFNLYPYLNNIDGLDYILLNRDFIKDEMYFDTIKLYKNEMTYDEYKKIVNFSFSDGYLFHETGLLKGVK